VFVFFSSLSVFEQAIAKKLYLRPTLIEITIIPQLFFTTACNNIVGGKWNTWGGDNPNAIHVISCLK